MSLYTLLKWFVIGIIVGPIIYALFEAFTDWEMRRHDKWLKKNNKNFLDVWRRGH